MHDMCKDHMLWNAFETYSVCIRLAGTNLLSATSTSATAPSYPMPSGPKEMSYQSH